MARFSIQGVPKQNERTVREKCIKSQRRGIPFYKTGAQWDKRSILAHQSDFCVHHFEYLSKSHVENIRESKEKSKNNFIIG